MISNLIISELAFILVFCCSFTEDDILGEADSFVGQSPPPSEAGYRPPPGSSGSSSSLPASLFANTGIQGADPFSHVGPGTPPRPPAGVTPPSSQGHGYGGSPLVPTSHVPASTHMSSVPPMPNTGGRRVLSTFISHITIPLT